MTPLSFDPVTAREMLGDDRARKIEEAARADADKGVFSPPASINGSYWDGAQSTFAEIVYREQHKKRLARIARKAANEAIESALSHKEPKP